MAAEPSRGVTVTRISNPLGSLDLKSMQCSAPKAVAKACMKVGKEAAQTSFAVHQALGSATPGNPLSTAILVAGMVMSAAAFVGAGAARVVGAVRSRTASTQQQQKPQTPQIPGMGMSMAPSPNS